MGKNYAVIVKWTEPNGTEEWDIIHDGPLTYDEASEIASKARNSWTTNALNVSTNLKDIAHSELVITCEKLEEMLKEN